MRKIRFFKFQTVICFFTDVDGNKYLDFSSGIYVTSLGHSLIKKQ